MPTTPHSAAGWRIEPPVSVPSASGANAGGDRGRRAAARAARDARRDPTGCASAPNAEFSVDEPIANSSMFVLPSETSPARLAPGCTTVAVVRRHVALEDARARRRLLALVQRMSLSAIGTPSRPDAAVAVERVGLGERGVAAGAQEGVERRRRSRSMRSR